MGESRPTLYLVDGSGYVFRAFHALPPLSTSAGVPTNAVYGFARMLLKLIKQAKPTHLGIVFDSPKKTFRDDLFADYKANRPAVSSDLLLQLTLINRLVEALGIKLLVVDGYEADDVLGTLALRAAREGFEVVIITGDKDFAQLVGPRVSLWDTMRDKRTTLRDVHERFGLEPRQLIDVMALTGDAIDNIKGVPGIGEKRAIALVKRFGSLNNLLKHLDELKESGSGNERKLACAIAENRSSLELAQKLVRIDTEVPLHVELKEFEFKGLDQIDRKALSSLAKELEFHSLMRELLPDSEPKVVDDQTPTPETELARAWERLAGCSQLFVHLSQRGNGSPTLKLKAEGADNPAYIVTTLTLDRIAPLLEAPKPSKACHDAKAHIRGLKTLGVKLSGISFDTMLAGFLINPDRPEPSLELLYEEHVRDDGKRPRARSEPEMVEALVPLLGQRLEQDGVKASFDSVELPLASILAEMEETGVLVDTNVLRDIADKFASEMQEIEAECQRLAGRSFNLNSPTQLRQVLFEELKLPTKGIKRTKTGLSTDSEALAKLAEYHPLPERVLRYRVLAKLKSSYVDSLPQLIDPKTGRLHTTFHQAVTATGRLSSSGPNLQNIPARGPEGLSIRRAFVATPGFALLSADYSQIELRVLAHLSGDTTLIDAFRSGQDIHARTASEILGIRPEDVGPETRRLAKVINFGLLYGMGPQRLARELGVEHKVAADYINRYFERLRGVKEYFEQTLAAARKNGFVTTMFGRRRYLPELNSQAAESRAQAERAALNTPVQGSAAEIIKLAMVRFDGLLRQSDVQARLLLQVHDELLLEVEANKPAIMQVAELVKTAMEGAAELRVPLRVDLKSGLNWADLENLAIE